MVAAALATLTVLACSGRIGTLPASLSDGGSDAGLDAGQDAGTDAGTDAGNDAGADAGWDAGWPDASACPPPFSGAGAVVATGLSYPRHLVSDGERLYVTEVGVLNKPFGRVLAVDLDGGVTELATDRSSPDAIALDATNLYWVDEGGLWRYPLPSGPPVLLDSKVNGALQGTTSIALTATQVLYATGQSRLELSKKNGKGNSTLFTGAPGTVVRAAAVEGATGYFLYSGGPDAGLYQVSLSGAPNPTQLLPEPLDGRDLLVTPDAFFWAAGVDGGGAVQTLARPSGPVTDVATGLGGPLSVRPLDGFIYFQDSTAGGGATPWFFQVAAPCLPQTPIPVGPIGQGPGDVLYDADAGTLFFTSYAGSGQGYVGRLP